MGSMLLTSGLHIGHAVIRVIVLSEEQAHLLQNTSVSPCSFHIESTLLISIESMLLISEHTIYYHLHQHLLSFFSHL